MPAAQPKRDSHLERPGPCISPEAGQRPCQHPMEPAISRSCARALASAQMRAPESRSTTRPHGTTTRSAGGYACFLAKEQSWRTAWRTRSLLSRTRTGTGQSFAGVYPFHIRRSVQALTPGQFLQEPPRGCGGWGMGAGVIECRSGVRPGPVGGHAVAALGLVSAHSDDVQPVGAGLEGAHDRRRDADDIPLADLADLVVEPHAPRA
jgi:hypothetical protein